MPKIEIDEPEIIPLEWEGIAPGKYRVNARTIEGRYLGVQDFGDSANDARKNALMALENLIMEETKNPTE